MRIIFKPLFSVFLAVVMFMPMAQAQDVLFDDLEWVARVIVVTGDRSEPDVNDFLGALEADPEGLYERDMVVIHYHGRVLETLSDLSIFPRDTRILEERGEYRYYEQALQTTSNEFSVTLIGKDGRIKNRWFDDPPSSGDLFAIIDDMPMRQRELERR